MNHPDPTNISTAFEMLLETIEEEIAFLNEAGSKAFAAGKYEQVEATREQAVKLTTYRDKVLGLRREWKELSTSFVLDDEDAELTRQDLGRLPRGVRTPGEAYRIPILQALVDMGGSGHIQDVLQRVEKQMEHILNEADHQTLPSNNSLRWYNTAQWERQALVNEGLMRNDSPRGTWQISDAGRRFLKEHSS